MEQYYPEKILAFCPRCGGSGFHPGHESNCSVCPVCKFELYYNPATSTAAIIKDSQGRILLSVRAHDPAKGMLDLPGGFLSRFETAEECLTREVKEELNLEVSKLTYLTSLPNRYLYGGMVVFTIDMVYLCEVQSFDGLKVADDVVGVRFLAPGEINLAEVGLDSMRKALSQYLGRS
jgi:ADP-ribose pyrophosphatase YjhB (NUDIX family)